jgi:hypothetical protein
MSVIINWTSYDDSTATSFNIYRAITGISVTFPNSLQSGDVFQFSATSQTVQKVTIGATDITSVATAINTQAQGLQATVSQSGLILFIRCTATLNPKLKLYPCTFLTDTGIPVQIIGPKMNPALVTTVSANTPPYNYSYNDPDGSPYDWYYITSVVSSVESIPSIWQQPLVVPGMLCVVEGRVKTVQNSPIVGAIIKASPIGGVAVSDDSGLTFPPVTVYTDQYGRWTLPVLQGTQILFQIPAIGYNQVVEIPAQPYMLFSNLVPVNDYYFSPDGDLFGQEGLIISGDFDFVE